MTILTFTALWVNSVGDVDDMFLVFAKKHDLTFLANCRLKRQFA